MNYFYLRLNVLGCNCAAKNMGNLPMFFLIFKEGARVLRVNDTKHDTESPSNLDDFGFGVNSESKCYERDIFGGFLQNLERYFHP